MADALTEIFRAASKHPNSRVSKLIHQVEGEPTQKNIVLLLIELAEHAEYSIDFNVSLKYYLNLFERCGLNHDMVLNEAGLLLVNSSKIYSKRVDYVQSIVERQILTLSNADDELQKQKTEQEQTENAIPTEKTKRGRKRALEAPSDPYEVELAPKKFKKITEEKRFALPKVVAKSKSISRNIEMEQQIHPAGWQHATIYDLENEEDVDTKRNYKLFTYHVEHRYNTLVPDINFRLHFKVKDYMDEQEEMEEDEACNTDRSWPPLSEAYVQKYLRLENYVLQQDVRENKRKQRDNEENAQEMEGEKQKDAEIFNIDSANETQQNLNTSNINESVVGKNSSELESTLACSVTNISLNLEADLSNKTFENLESSGVTEKNDSGLGQSILNETNNTLERTQLNCSLETSQATEILNPTLLEGNISANTVENDSVLKTNTLIMNDNIENETTENTASLNTTSKDDLTLEFSSNSENNTTAENESALELSGVQQTSNAENDTKENIGDLSTITGTENECSNQLDQNINQTDCKSEKSLDIDVSKQQDKNSTQIHVHLPNADDEGVCLSDLDDLDCRLLSPIIKTRNILPGVERKDITIVMDDELREALELRDGILKHFGNETFTVPVITEPRKPDLIFNILKLPEKQLRRKILFKLGPDMDLFLQARSLKRTLTDSVTRAGRNVQMLKWFPLNNTDMTDVFMTPPSSPDFCGFSNNEDDTASCADFFGFTEEEQSILMAKSICRLSRDSGVGVDVNSLTPEKERLQIIFGESGDQAQSTESILKDLPAEIREALTLELAENSENNETETSELSSALLTSNNTKETEDLSTTNGTVTQLNESCSADNSQNLTESSELLTENNTKESESISENCSATKSSEAQNQSSAIEGDTGTSDSDGIEVTTPSNETSNKEQCTKSTEDVLKENPGLANTTETPGDEDDIEMENAEDSFTFDLNTQGNKTKIQQWHEHLQPILVKSRERHHFDVYQLGTEIIETVKSNTSSTVKSHTSAIAEPLNDLKITSGASNGPVASFANVMVNKDTSYVSRYFLSTLLLANQSNIEISIQNKSSETPSSWHDINLKLLSTKRHTVAIEDNIGMIDSKQKARIQQNSREIQKNTSNGHQGEHDDVPLIKLQNSTNKLKPPLKRVFDVSNTPCAAEKKHKESTAAKNRRHKTLPNLIESVQIIAPPFASPIVDTSVMPSTSRQTQHKNAPLFNININAIRTLQPIEKKLANQKISKYFRQIKNIPIMFS